MKILAAIDQSTYAEKVLAKAIDLAKREEVELTILSVVEPNFADAAEIGAQQVIFEQFRKNAENLVNQAQQKAKNQGVAAKTLVLEGTSVASRIVQHAEQHGVDLIIMGHKGRSAIERFLVGSVASRVVAYAPCSVLVVR
ncbi:universal stress protein [Desulfocurvibacter africanus]|uniref:Universal stress protein n=1 Tax=Desulfocurvibacter africanus subsp. africanus str. Walvis Bay TaxID=690850 RepID=F3Z1C5_DESAF|nr:universal stress protein [Desulfocurvibacter africanus]EGJ51128.1 UspA domain-containing protein [Desulfocurvibacter africanus subsp. africanus str. Walvis Bay]